MKLLVQVQEISVSEGGQEQTLQSLECTERETEAPSGASLLKVLQRGVAQLGSDASRQTPQMSSSHNPTLK